MYPEATARTSEPTVVYSGGWALYDFTPWPSIEITDPDPTNNNNIGGSLPLYPLYCNRPIDDFDNIILGNGDDYLVGTDMDDLIVGFGGDDVIIAENGDDCIYAGSGNDFVSGRGGNDIIYAGPGDDFVRGNSGNDIIFGDEGQDKLMGDNGIDTISGGDDNDMILGNKGNDTLNGDSGDDFVNGNRGDDIVNGDAGNDILVGGRDNDTINGGSGTDICDGYAGVNEVDCNNTAPECGNGVRVLGEECDDGGESITCDDDCTFAVCGDEVLNTTSGEQCDDGNTIDGDGCSASCLTEGSSALNITLGSNAEITGNCQTPISPDPWNVSFEATYDNSAGIGADTANIIDFQVLFTWGKMHANVWPNGSGVVNPGTSIDVVHNKIGNTGTFTGVVGCDFSCGDTAIIQVTYDVAGTTVVETSPTLTVNCAF
jgi:cysteine-rich repeat protein